MFRSLFTSLSIYLQGTLFERRPKLMGRNGREEWMNQRAEEAEEVPPYLLLTPECVATKHDLISKMNGADCRRMVRTGETKRARQKWHQNTCEQNYIGNRAVMDPRIEIYWKTLGLSNAHDEELDW